MDTGELERVTISIDKMLQDLSPISSDSCIFKAPNELRMVNEKAFEPQRVSIGPYHRGKQHLLPMEEHKKRYLQQLLQRFESTSVSKYVEAMRKLEQRARKNYAESVSLSNDEFVEMMVLDGCFFVELMWKFIDEFSMENPDFQFEHMLSRIYLDLLLLENQLPFFVLEELFFMNSFLSDQTSLIKLILVFFHGLLPGEGYDLQDVKEVKQIKHLLELVHDNWQPLPPRMQSYLSMRRNQVTISFPRCAIKLQEAGIKFKKVEGQNLFDISFKNGEISLPKLRIGDQTQSLMRNLIAYEQLNPGGTSLHVTEYMTFMDSIINSGKDVELLSHMGIIENCLGDHETVATLFNKIGDNVICDRALYADIQDELDMHCKKPWNLRMANLRHNYFQSPWSVISVLAAFILLSLTVAQTVYSVLSYCKTN